MKQIKAIVLFSGGLDSLIVVKILEEQGIVVKAINYRTPFFGGEGVKKIGDYYNIRVIVEDISREYINNVLLSPDYGYGKNMNPCIDCHRYMVKKAKERVDRGEADFIATGEVLGERPFSQNKNALSIVDSPARGYVLRPLSARLLNPTIPELKGWVDRSKLYDLKGRSRKRHFELAKKYGIDRIPSPAGGCVLTDPGFSYRLRHYIDNEKIKIPTVNLLRLGRHFFINNSRLIIPRDEKERRQVEAAFSLIHNALLIKAEDGFTALAYNVDEEIEKIVEICSAYIRNSKKLKIITKEREKEYPVVDGVEKFNVRKYLISK